MQFWRHQRVCQETGLHKSTIYKLIAAGAFPSSHQYRDINQGVFWRSDEVESWKRAQLGLSAEEIDEVLG